MSTIFNIRNMKLPNMSRATLIVGTLVVVLALGGGYRRLAAVQEADHHHAWSPTSRRRSRCIPVTRSRSWASGSAPSTRSSPQATR